MMSHVPNGLTVNTEYKYEDMDICAILDLRLRKKNLMKSSRIFTIAPIAEQENKLVEFLSDEKKKHKRWPIRTLLIPYLIGCTTDGHWVGIVVKFWKNIPQKLDYYDSLSRPMTD